MSWIPSPHRVRSPLLVVAICLTAMASVHLAPKTLAQIERRRQLVQPPATVDKWPAKGKRFALVIGVDEYEDTQINPLTGAANDAKALADALVRYAGFPRDQVILLASDQPRERRPTHGEILARLSNLRGLVPADGLLLVSFAGHGMEREGRGFLCPADARINGDMALLEDTAISVEVMRERIRQTGVKQVVVILDACRNDPSGRGESENKLTESYAHEFNFDVRNRDVTAFATLYATEVGSVAYEYKEKKQGYFTWALVEGLKGAAANDKGEVTLAGLRQYLEEAVPKQVRLDLGREKKQRPWAEIQGYKAEELVISVTGRVSTVPETATGRMDPAAVELSFWDSIKASTDPEDFREYLMQFPEGRFAGLARNRVRNLAAAAKRESGSAKALAGAGGSSSSGGPGMGPGSTAEAPYSGKVPTTTPVQPTAGVDKARKEPAANASVLEIEGTVKLNTPQGLKAVPGAQVDIYRTDIDGHWEVKADENGHYIRLGMPVAGVYLIVVSGRGASPVWVNNIHIASNPIIDVECNPGDGSTLTYEDVQKQIAAQGGGVHQFSAATQPAAADKAKADPAAKANAETAAKNEELKASYSTALAHFKQGVALKQGRDLPGALVEFKQAAAVDPTIQAAFAEVAYKAEANAAQINYDIGVDLFNAKKRDDAKPYFESAINEVTRSINIVRASPEKDKPAVKNDLIINYDLLTKNVRVLVEHFGEANRVEDTTDALDQVEAIDLPANRDNWELVRGDLYRSAGRTDAAAAAYKGVLARDVNSLDAIYGIGLTLIMSPDKALLQEAVNYLGDFIAKAPVTDKRVPEVKSALDTLKAANNVQPEKSSNRKRGNL
jgi:tetratricopeptide (TPR) repeat protein